MLASASVLHRPVALAVTFAITVATPAVVGATDRTGDQQIADESVLTTTDMPTGFSATTPEDTSDSPKGAACAGIRAAARALHAAPHTKVEFQTQPDSAGDNALITNQVAVLATAKKAKAAYAPYAAKSAKACLETDSEQSIRAALNDPSAKVKVSAARFVPGYGTASVGYRVRVDASAKGESKTYYVDIELVRVGRGLDGFEFVNAGAPPPAADVADMTDTGVKRLAASL